MRSVSKMLAAAVGALTGWLITQFPWLADTPLADAAWVEGLVTILVTAGFVYFAPKNEP